MNALALIVALALRILTAPLSVDAQGSANVFRIGLLRPGSPSTGSDPLDRVGLVRYLSMKKRRWSDCLAKQHPTGALTPRQKEPARLAS